MNTGLLLLRLLLAGLLFGHATQKLLGWFRGQGPEATARVFESWGFRPGRPMVLLAGVCELAGAAMFAAGAAVPFAAAVVAGTMIVAASPTWRNGLWAHLGGCEVPVMYGALALVLACTGPGGWSVDHALGAGGLHGPAWALAAAAVAMAAAVPALLARHRTPGGDTGAAQGS